MRSDLPAARSRRQGARREWGDPVCRRCAGPGLSAVRRWHRVPYYQLFHLVDRRAGPDRPTRSSPRPRRRRSRRRRCTCRHPDGTSLDLTVGQDTATGTVTQDGLTAELLAVDGTTYLKGDKAFWDNSSGAGRGRARRQVGGRRGTPGRTRPGWTTFTDVGRRLRRGPGAERDADHDRHVHRRRPARRRSRRRAAARRCTWRSTGRRTRCGSTPTSPRPTRPPSRTWNLPVTITRRRRTRWSTRPSREADQCRSWRTTSWTSSPRPVRRQPARRRARRRGAGHRPMQSLAREFHLSETTFPLRRPPTRRPAASTTGCASSRPERAAVRRPPQRRHGLADGAPRPRRPGRVVQACGAGDLPLYVSADGGPVELTGGAPTCSDPVDPAARAGRRRPGSRRPDERAGRRVVRHRARLRGAPVRARGAGPLRARHLAGCRRPRPRGIFVVVVGRRDVDGARPHVRRRPRLPGGPRDRVGGAGARGVAGRVRAGPGGRRARYTVVQGVEMGRRVPAVVPGRGRRRASDSGPGLRRVSRRAGPHHRPLTARPRDRFRQSFGRRRDRRPITSGRLRRVVAACGPAWRAGPPGRTSPGPRPGHRPAPAG